MKLISIAFLNLSDHDNKMIRYYYPNIYDYIIEDIYKHINTYCKIKTIYIKYKKNNLYGYKSIDNYKFYKLT